MAYNSIDGRKNIQIIQTDENGGLKIEILEYQKLLGSKSAACAQGLYFMSQQNIKCRQVVLHMRNTRVITEAGAMSYIRGKIEMTSGVTLGNMIGKMISGKMTGESTAKPEYTGTGMLVLEPSFEHYIILNLDDDAIIVDKGMFLCAQGGVEVKPVVQKTLSAAVAGGEGLFQILLRGSGLVVLESPVPMVEVEQLELINDIVKVDGNFVLLRSADLEFTVTRSAKTLTGSAISGEGLVNCYKGTGVVWLAPTISIYKKLS